MHAVIDVFICCGLESVYIHPSFDLLGSFLYCSHAMFCSLYLVNRLCDGYRILGNIGYCGIVVIVIQMKSQSWSDS